jgi:excisionase family DNA binding protein
MEKFFSTFEVARMCYVSPGSVIRWIHEGKLEAGLTAGGHHRVPAEAVLQLLESLRMPIPLELQELSRVETQNRKHTLTLLIVDDEPGMRQMIHSVLEQQFRGVRIEEAADGFHAGWKAHQLRPDLVILDIMLPGLNGYRVCELIRKFPEMSHTKIIAMTGVPDPEAQAKILKLGADGFIAKPFDVDALKEMIVNQLMNAQGQGAAKSQ